MNGQGPGFQAERSFFPAFGPGIQRPFLTMHLPNLFGGYSRPMHFQEVGLFSRPIYLVPG
jgi:hypothetical protein